MLQSRCGTKLLRSLMHVPANQIVARVHTYHGYQRLLPMSRCVLLPVYCNVYKENNDTTVILS